MRLARDDKHGQDLFRGDCVSGGAIDCDSYSGITRGKDGAQVSTAAARSRRKVGGQMKKPLRCHFGFHAYVTQHPEEGTYAPPKKVCRLCGKRPIAGENLPFSGSGGGGAGV